MEDVMVLERGSALRVVDGGGALVHIWQGEAWLTQEGDVRDHVLVAGQSFRLDRNGVALVQALKRCAVSLTPAAARSRVPAVQPIPAPDLPPLHVMAA